VPLKIAADDDGGGEDLHICALSCEIRKSFICKRGALLCEIRETEACSPSGVQRCFVVFGAEFCGRLVSFAAKNKRQRGEN
jgi:hypothetical protein